MSGNAFGRIVRLVARRPVPVLVLTLALLALGGAALALRLEPSAATDTLVEPLLGQLPATPSASGATSATRPSWCW